MFKNIVNYNIMRFESYLRVQMKTYFDFGVCNYNVLSYFRYNYVSAQNYFMKGTR